jgi:HAD superfamily hydrolase (TIGR01509 family)
MRTVDFPDGVPRMISGILWDNDGVLTDTERLFFETNRDFLRQYRIELSQENFFEWFLCESRGAWHLLIERGVGADQIDALRHARNALYSERLKSEADLLNPGVDDILRKLHGRVDMGIVTSANQAHFDAIHGQLDIARYFRFALTEGTYACSKPSPDPYLLGLQRMGLRADQCIVVEDAPRGLQSALAAGIRCIILRNSLTRHHRFDGAYRVVDSMEALHAELEALIPHS